MADSKLCKARKRMKTIAAGITADGLTLDAERIHLGCRAAGTEFSAAFELRVNRPVLHIASASLGFSGSQYPLVVESVLTVPLSAAADQAWSDVDNLVVALRAAWLLAGNYPAGEVAGKVCDIEASKVELRGDLTLVRVSLLLAFTDPDA